jgi:septal ring factor EnvC (AmiA/AmiB activator)
MKTRNGIRFAAFLVLAAACSLDAADQPDGDARLRESLRTTMQQLNDAQSQLASLQASQAAAADDRKTLADQVAILTKRIADVQAASAKELDAAKAKLADQQAELARLQDGVSQWKAAAEKAVLAARTAAAQRDKEAANAIAMQRRADDLASRNAELFRLGSEILDRYEKFGLGEQFLAREPFVGRARVELENQVSDYEDKLLAEKDNP